MQAARKQAAACDQRGAFLAHARTAAFVVAVLPGVAYGFGHWPGPSSWAFVLSGLAALAYVVLASQHDRTLTEERRAQLRTALCQRALDRIGGHWRSLVRRGDRFVDPDHLYGVDLNLFGQGSLFQLLDETSTRPGEALLASWFRKAAASSEIQARQEMVRELSSRTEFRHRFQTELERLTAGPQPLTDSKADPSAFLSWCESRSELDAIRWARPLAWPLPLLTLALFVLGRAAVIPRGLFWPSLGLQLVVAALCARPFGRLYRAVAPRGARFLRYEEAFRVLENEPLHHPQLHALVRVTRDNAASDRLRRFGRIFAFVEVRQSPQLHAALQALTLWDLHWLFRLDDWRARHGSEVRRWFEALAELEATLSLAGFAHDRPAFSFPELEPLESENETPTLEARALGHPLLDAPVTNDVSLRDRNRILVVTGSNMSGKSTWLRTLGLNAVLAQTGAPVCARSLRLSSPLSVLTSMRVSDSLELGVSYFYAEVKRLKALIDGAVQARGRVLFLLDEILLGTNSRERQIASREILRLLAATGAIGAVTTHDLSLAELSRESGLALINVHFQDSLLDGRMQFDYRMRPGVAESTNALRLLRAEGVLIPETL